MKNTGPPCSLLTVQPNLKEIEGMFIHILFSLHHGEVLRAGERSA